MYNGWTNYQTWRIGSDVMDDSDWNDVAYGLGYEKENVEDATDELAERIKNECLEPVYSLANDWKRDLLELAMEDVNWDEVARVFEEDIERGVKEATDDEEDL